MKKILGILHYPLQGAPLVLILLFSFLYLISLRAGLFGIPLASMLSIWYFKYCFRVADASANGEENAPILEYEDIFPFHELRPLKLVVVVSLYASLFYFAGGLKLSIAMTSILLPAIVWALIMEDSFLSAINPIRLLFYMRQVGLSYILPVFLMGLMSYVLVLSFDYHLGVLFILLFILYIVIMLFHVLGLVLHGNRTFVGYEGRSRREQWQLWDQMQEDKEKGRRLHHWYLLAKASKYPQVLDEMKAYLSSKNDTLSEYEGILDELWTWERTRLAEMFSNIYLERLLQEGKKREALQYLKNTYQHNRRVIPDKEEVILELANYAREHGFFDVMLEILRDFETTHSDSSQMAHVVKSRAQVLCFELQNCHAAVEYMQQMRKRFSWLQYDTEFNALFREVDSLRNAK